MDIQTIQTGSFSMRYFCFGEPHGQPLAVIPGVAIKSVMEAADAVREQYRMFSEGYCIYVFDRRADMPCGYSVYDMADDTAEAMAALGLCGADVYGVSQGGMIAQVIAERRPELVRRLALCSTAANVPQNAGRILEQWAEYAESGKTAELVLSFGEYVYSRAYFDACREAFLAFGETVTPEDLCRFCTMVRGTRGFSANPEALHCPVLVMAGAQDRIFGAEPAQEIARRTGGTLFTYAQGAHGVYDEDPDVLTRLAAFLGA